MSYFGNKGVVSTNNSTATPLCACIAFTGTGEDVSRYSTITVIHDTDVDGTLSMQFSTDNSNWDRAKVVCVDQTLASGSVHTLEVVAQYFRVVYTNGSSGQAHFRLQTIYHTDRSGFLTSSPDQMISKMNDAQIIRVSNDAILDISRGLYSDKAAIRKFGHNEVVPNASWADVWAYGPTDATYNWPTTAETFRIQAGGNAADTAAGAGATEITIVYLDANGDEQQETIATAGACASSATSNTGRRVNRAWVSAVGTYGASNTGRIIIENTSTNQIVATIEAGIGQTEQSQYTVPLGYTAYLTRIEIDVDANKDADLKFWQRRDAYDTSAPMGAKRLIREWDAIVGQHTREYSAAPSFPSLTDLWFEAYGNGAATEVDVEYDLILVLNEAPKNPQ
jgi:hypothetical protein